MLFFQLADSGSQVVRSSNAREEQCRPIARSVESMKFVSSLSCTSQIARFDVDYS